MKDVIKRGPSKNDGRLITTSDENKVRRNASKKKDADDNEENRRIDEGLVDVCSITYFTLFLFNFLN